MSQQRQPRVISAMMGRGHSGHCEELPVFTWIEEGTPKNSGRGNVWKLATKEMARLGHILARSCQEEPQAGFEEREKQSGQD